MNFHTWQHCLPCINSNLPRTFDLLNAMSYELNISILPLRLWGSHTLWERGCIYSIHKIPSPIWGLVSQAHKLWHVYWAMVMPWFTFLIQNNRYKLPCRQWSPSWVCPPRPTSPKGILLDLFLVSSSCLLICDRNLLGMACWQWAM